MDGVDLYQSPIEIPKARMEATMPVGGDLERDRSKRLRPEWSVYLV